MSDLTILMAQDGKVLAKTILPTATGWQKDAYDRAYTFDIETAPIASLDGLSAVLTMIEDIPSACVIRGRRRPGAPLEGIQRRLHDQPGERAAFEEQASQWLMIDIDDLPAYPLLTNGERLEHITSQLPACFQDADFHYQWSSSAGLDDWSLLRAHLFFWLDRPIRCNDLRQQADDEGWAADLSLFNPVQIHYTAAPIFEGAEDPLKGCRSGIVRKARREVTLPAWSPPKPVWTPEGRVYPAAATFEDRLAAIGPDYHLPILKAAASYVATHGPSADIYDLRDRLKDAISAAPPGRNAKRDYLADRYLDRVIQGAVRKFSTARIDSPTRTRGTAKFGL